MSFAGKEGFVRRSPLLVLGLLILLLGAACRFTPSPEDQAKIDALEVELKAVKAEVAVAEEKNSGLAGGLVKALVEVRLEVLKTTEALIQQRIQAIASGARVTATVAGSQADPKLAQSLEADIKKQRDELKVAQADAAQYSGGLVGTMKQATVATQEQSLAMLRHRYLAAKYGLPVAAPAAPAGAASTADAKPTVKPTAGARSEDLAKNIVTVRLLRKRYAERD